jgi:molybdopterin-guanine dinucleotide biosynthesis protein A
MNCILLAKGEKSLRLGKIKPFILFHEKPLIEIILEKTTELFENIYIVTTKKEKFKMYENEKVFLIEDNIKCGPLGGILLGLKHSNSYYNFVLPIDLLFINNNLLKYMEEKKKDYDILYVKTKDFIQPLCGIYSKKVLKYIEQNIKKGQYKVKSILQSERFNIKIITEKEIEKFGNPMDMFFNLNTKEDLNWLKEIENGITSGSN